MVPPDDAITTRRAPALTAASKRPTELARLVFTCSLGSRAALWTPPLEARCRTTSGLKVTNALATPSDPQSAETTSTSPGSGSPHGWLWSSMTSTLALAATSMFVAAPLAMTREHTGVFTLCPVARIALVHDIAGVAAIQAQLLREAGHEVDRISLPQIGASWSWPAKAITIPLRLLAYLPAVSRLRRGRYDVIHIHWLTQGIVGLLVGAPFFVQAHGSDLHVNLQSRVLRW